MPNRPVFHGLIGAELRELREARGWTQVQAIEQLRTRGRRRLVPLSLQQLRYLEEGRTKHPDADVLRAVAELYGVPYEELAERFVQANYGLRSDAQARNDAAPIRGEWRLVNGAESNCLNAFRRSNEQGRQSALAVLAVGRVRDGKRRPGPRASHQHRPAKPA